MVSEKVRDAPPTAPDRAIALSSGPSARLNLVLDVPVSLIALVTK